MSFIQYSMVQRSSASDRSGFSSAQRSQGSQDSDHRARTELGRQESIQAALAAVTPRVLDSSSQYSPKAYRLSEGQVNVLPIDFGRVGFGALPIAETGNVIALQFIAVLVWNKLANASVQNLGKSGLRVSNIALGTWVTFGSQVSDDVAEEMVTLAYESGVNVFDTAEVYAGGKAEIVLGKILQKKKWRRSSYIIMTKIYWGGKAETEKGLSRKHIIEGIKGSLERLQLDYVDIAFANKSDPRTPMEEIVRAFTYVINQGWAMYWSTSRWGTTEIMEAYSVARQFNLIPPIAEQCEYSLLTRDKVELHMPEMFHKIGLGLMTWSPLAGGFLTGKYDDGVPLYSRASMKGYAWLKDKILSEDGRRQQIQLREIGLIAERIGCSLAQLAIAWCLKNENVQCVILGASSVDQLYEDMQAIQFVPKLTTSVMLEIDTILGNKPVRTITKEATHNSSR